MIRRTKKNQELSLVAANPNLTLEWNYIKNSRITPQQISACDKTFVWWQCKNSAKHEWLATVYSRNIEKRGCPYCQGLIQLNSLMKT